MFGIRSRRNDRSPDSLPRPSRSWSGPLIYLVIGGVGGFVAGRFGRSALPNLTPETKWDIVDVMNILVTLIIAMYLQQWVVARGESIKARRAHLAHLAGGAENNIRDLHKIVRATTPVEGEAVLTALRDVNNAVLLLRDAVAMTQAPCSMAALEREWRRYGVMLQDYPWVPLNDRARIGIDGSFRRLLTLATKIVLELA